MKFTQRLAGVAIATVILVICFPISILATIITSSFWLWIENTFGIEAYGHSGPAEWCYLVIYLVIVSINACIWSRKRKYNKDYTKPDKTL